MRKRRKLQLNLLYDEDDSENAAQVELGSPVSALGKATSPATVDYFGDEPDWTMQVSKNGNVFVVERFVRKISITNASSQIICNVEVGNIISKQILWSEQCFLTSE